MARQSETLGTVRLVRIQQLAGLSAALALAACSSGSSGGGGGGPAGPPSDFSVGIALHSISVGQTASVHTWGANNSGELGDGTTTSTTAPNAVAGISTATQVEAGGSFSLARLSTGVLKSWGDNTNGQLGNGSTTASLTPIDVSLANVTRVNLLGTSRTGLAQTGDGKVWAWGMNNQGQCANGATADVLTPAEIVPAANALDFSVGDFHGAAVLSTGAMIAWGMNTSGQLGDGTTTSSTTPVSVSTLTTATNVACGGTFTLALLADDTVRAFGDNSQGALGDGTTTNSSAPVTVLTLTNVSKIDATYDTAIALKTDGTVWTWGGGFNGQLGNGTNTPSQTTPVQVGGLLTGKTIVDIDGGESSVLVIDSNGARYAWGANGTGLFGNGTTTASNVPVLVDGF